MTFIEKQIYNKEYLDKIDLKPYLRTGEDIRDIMWDIGIDYDERVSDDSTLNGDIFNCMDTDDFVAYLKERYGAQISYWEEVHYELRGFDEINK